MTHVAWGIILAGGKGEELDSIKADTAFLPLGDKPVLAYSLEAFDQCPDIEGIVVVLKKDRVDALRNLVQMYGVTKIRKVVTSSGPRSKMIGASLKALDPDVTISVIHEASRPFVNPDLITETIKASKRYGCGASATKIQESVKYVEKGQKVSKTMEGQSLWIVQTPQAFKLELLQKGLDEATKKKVTLQEETEAIELLKKEVHLVPASDAYMKIRTPEDLIIANALLK